MKIIFIIVDCMRWDYMSGNGYPRLTTPNLDRIAAESCVFDRAYATINQTDQSLTSIFSGNYPLTHGLGRTAASMSHQELASVNAWRMQYLPQMLKDAGFVTLGVDWLDRWHQWGYDWYWIRDKQKVVGFLHSLAARIPKVTQFGLRLMQRFKVRMELGRLGIVKPGVGAETATDLTLNFLRQHRDQDMFIMLHYWDAHIPYYIERGQFLDEMRTVALPEEDQDVRALVKRLCTSDERKNWLLTHVVRDAKTTGDLATQHCAALRVVDEQIGRIYQFVVDKHLMDQTIFVITADHGENLFEPGYFWEHSGVRENIVRIPLIMSIPGIKPSRVNQVVSHVDIVPTLIDYLKLHINSNFDGQSLLSLIVEQKPLDRESIYFQSRSQVVEPQWGIVGDRYKYVESRKTDVPPCKYCGERHIPPVELYDLLEDGEERNNLAESRPDLARQMGTNLKQLVDHLIEKSTLTSSKNSETGKEVYSDSEKTELEERLRSLGYFE